MASRMNLSEEHHTQIKTVKSLCENESPEPSCVSMKSDASMIQPITFSSGDSPADLSQKHEGPGSHTAKKNLDSIFKADLHSSSGRRRQNQLGPKVETHNYTECGPAARTTAFSRDRPREKKPSVSQKCFVESARLRPIIFSPTS